MCSWTIVHGRLLTGRKKNTFVPGPFGDASQIQLDAGLVEAPRKKPHALIKGPTVMSNAPSEPGLYRIASEMKSNSSGSTGTGCLAASRFTRDSE